MARISTSNRTDAGWIARAAALARKAEGLTSPNPPVGAIVIADGRPVGIGYHRRVGTPHAERIAMDMASDKTRGATLYVTLEPCCHTGRTEPCTDAIIRAGIQRVVGGVRDPNPLVNGQGFERLRSAGIDVTEGICETSCSELIFPHRINMIRRRPFFHLKLALSFDGCIAPAHDRDYWLTGMPARRYVHRLRGRYDAVLVGIETILKDNPLLTVRFRTASSKQPHAVILDSGGRLPVDSAITHLARDIRDIIILHTGKVPAEQLTRFADNDFTAIQVDEDEYGRISIPGASEALWSLGIYSILVEGGGRVASSFIRSGLVDRISLIGAPLLLGTNGIPAFPDLDIKGFHDRISLNIEAVRRLGKDILIESTIPE